MTPPRPAHSASLRTRAHADGTPVFDVRFRLDSKQKTLSFETAKAAIKWQNIVKAIGPTEALKFLNLDLTEGSPSVNEYAERYINSKSGIEGKTTDHYRMYMRLHIAPVMGPLPIDAVSPETVAGWINAQSVAGVASKTIKNRHGFLSAMFQNAVDDGLLAQNPCRRSRLPESESVEMVFLSANEFTTLLAYVPVKYQPLVLLLAATGLRWGEATALKPGDFDLEQRSVRVSRAWKSSLDKGWYLGPPKTRRSKRTVSLPDDLIPTLRPLVDGGGEFVFTNAYGKPVRQQNFYSGVWDPARRLANGLPPFDKAKLDKSQPWAARANGVWDREPATVPLGKHPRIHDLRHSHASWLIAKGVPLTVIQRRLGHESIQTTSDVYSHLSPDMTIAAANAVGEVLAGAMPQLLP